MFAIWYEPVQHAVHQFMLRRCLVVWGCMQPRCKPIDRSTPLTTATGNPDTTSSSLHSPRHNKLVGDAKLLSTIRSKLAEDGTSPWWTVKLTTMSCNVLVCVMLCGL